MHLDNWNKYKIMENNKMSNIGILINWNDGQKLSENTSSKFWGSNNWNKCHKTAYPIIDLQVSNSQIANNRRFKNNN